MNNMVELELHQLENVSGGILPVFVGGFIAGYIAGKYLG